MKKQTFLIKISILLLILTCIPSCRDSGRTARPAGVSGTGSSSSSAQVSGAGSSSGAVSSAVSSSAVSSGQNGTPSSLPAGVSSGGQPAQQPGQQVQQPTQQPAQQPAQTPAPAPAQPVPPPAPPAPEWPSGGAVPSALSVPDLDGQNVFQNSFAAVDLSYTAYGFIKVHLLAPSATRIKVGIACGGRTYYYDLRTDGGTETFPLQMGSGSYSVTVNQNVSGTQYTTPLSTSMQVSLASSLYPYLVPSQIINYTSASRAATLARQLVSGKTNNYERISAVLSYVAQNIRYDYALAKTVQTGYVPDIDADLARGTGICYDYAAISAAMLRSLGYPTRLLMGYVQNGAVYHAWNEVYLPGQGWVKIMAVKINTSDWSRVDTTFVSTSTSPDDIAKFIADGSNYQTDKIY